jgi:hypothetical protein
MLWISGLIFCARARKVVEGCVEGFPEAGTDRLRAAACARYAVP